MNVQKMIGPVLLFEITCHPTLQRYVRAPLVAPSTD
jgi:hypothetical protein